MAGYHFLCAEGLSLQEGCGHNDFKYRPRRILALNGAIGEGVAGIFEKSLPVLGTNPS